MDSAALTLCRVTVNIQGAKAGSYVMADLHDPQLARMANAGILVPQVDEPVEAVESVGGDVPDLGTEAVVPRPTDEVLANISEHAAAETES